MQHTKKREGTAWRKTVVRG